MSVPGQVQGPPPTITEVISGNNSLLVRWQQDVYSESDDATLLVVNTETNEMQSILFNSKQIDEDEYLIEGLTNGQEYAVLFSVIYTDGVTHNSNTKLGTPSDVPAAPVINSYTLAPSTFSSVTLNVTLGANGGSKITGVVFRIFRGDNDNKVTTQSFEPSNNGDYTLTSLVAGGDYIISCQAQNVAGYGMVSNSVSFINSGVPTAPTLSDIDSGENAQVTLKVSGTSPSNPNEITGFKVEYKLSSSSTWLSQTFSRAVSAGSYTNEELLLTGLQNDSVGYSFKVAALNVAGTSAYSSPKNAEPAIKLAFSSAVVSFPANNQIKVDFARNVPSWPVTGKTVVGFSGTSVPVDAQVDLLNSLSPTSATYTLPSGTLSTGQVYTVTIDGFTIVPQQLYGTYWVQPILTDLKWPADQVSANATYATVPDAVSNITYRTDIVDPADPNSGAIQFYWVAPNANGSAIIKYKCQLYSVVQGVRTALAGKYIETSGLNCLFTGLTVANMYYAVGIIAENDVGDSTETYEPSTNTGIAIVDAVAPVTNLVGVQTNYNADSNPKFTGKLTWNYLSALESGYSSAVFKIYKDGSQVGSINYSSGQTDYQLTGVNLGDVANTTFNFAVEVVATIQAGGSSTSTKVYVSITTGVAPIISNVVVNGTAGQPATWTLSFKVSNPSNALMVPNSINAIVMPNPIDGITSKSPVFSGDSVFDTALVGAPGEKTYIINLGYEAISNDYVFITAANTNGSSVYQNKWGQPVSATV